MKAFMSIGILLLSAYAAAQKGSLSEQKMCYQQARKFVADTNAGSRDEWLFDQSHYDVKTKTCYVKLTRFFSSEGKPYTETNIADAYEGKLIGFCVSPTGEVEEGGGLLGGQKAKSRDEWDGLVTKLIPAFKP